MSASNNYTLASARAPGGGTEQQEQQRAHWEEDGAGWGNFLVELNEARDKAPDKRTLQHLQDVLRVVRDNLRQQSLNHITAGCIDRVRTSSVNCVHGGKAKMNSCSLVLVKLEFPDGFLDDEYNGPDESPFLKVGDDENDGRGYVPIAEYAAR